MTDGGAEEIWAQGVIEQNRRWMLAYLFALTGDRADAEDLVQEVFMIAYRKRAEFRKGESFGAWLRGIARNVALRHDEKRASSRILFDSASAWEAFDRRAAHLEEAHVDPEYSAHRLSVLRRCLERLTERARRLIRGRYGEGLSPAELAERSGVGSASVPVLLHRARAALGDCVRRHLSADPQGGGA